MTDATLTYLFARVQGDYTEKIVHLIGIVDEILYEVNSQCIVLSLEKEPKIWNDGFVVAFAARGSLTDVYEILKGRLSKVSCWTIFQNLSSYLESSPDGPLTEAKWALKDHAISFFFLLARKNEYAFSRHIDGVIASLKKATAYTVFSFSDGAVLAVSVSEPPKVTVNRCRRPLAQFSRWVFCNPMGETYRDDGEKACWMDTGLILEELKQDL